MSMLLTIIGWGICLYFAVCIVCIVLGGYMQHRLEDETRRSIHPLAAFVVQLFKHLGYLAAIVATLYGWSFGEGWGLLALVLSPIAYFGVRGIGILPVCLVQNWLRNLYHKHGWPWPPYQPGFREVYSSQPQQQQ